MAAMRVEVTLAPCSRTLFELWLLVTNVIIYCLTVNALRKPHMMTSLPLYIPVQPYPCPMESRLSEASAAEGACMGSANLSSTVTGSEGTV